MACEGECILLIEGAERHLSDGQRRTEIRLDHLELKAGKTYALCGPSGIGKTTALEMLSLAAKPDVLGAMVLTTHEEPVELHTLMASGRSDRLATIRGRYFGYIVQTAHLFPFLSVKENIQLSQNIAKRPDPAFTTWLMEYLQIASLADSAPHHLSGGQRQRVCVARALAHRPSIVLADEPTSAVDQEIAATIVSLLDSYAKSEKAAVLVITHNTGLAERFSLERLIIDSAAAHGLLRSVIATQNTQVSSPGNQYGIV